ncbi:PxKF domain-containing protein [Kocuria oceani]|uniref:PxKF domain-containing protein n=1 Tax=Kocuria oceani TaxID=988827 RepID=UPI0040350FCC
MRGLKWLRMSAAVVTAWMFAAQPAAAQEFPEDPGAVIRTADCAQNTLAPNDDGSTASVPLPFGVNFYGSSFEKLWINNNGNVTFDGPLSSYTPFGLAGTSAKIIAPFFADVDTRGEGSQPVVYGWGETTYEGHRAFCVNWVNVGYYSGHTDKLNSFQLLLVQREDSDNAGDFDIVFNYDQIQWETGDASGGSGGLGGTSAAAGFSNGSGEDGTFFQLAGSLVNGAFLDSSPSALSATTTDSTLPGRHVFRVRGGNAPLTRYVALGDSFQSGEGAGDYLAPTDTDENKCHRSAMAYPKLLVAAGTVDLDLDFGACSGALTEDLAVSHSPDRPPYTDGIAQLDRLDSSTKLVTLGIGGNDLGFGPILTDCITTSVVDFFNPFPDTSCESKYGDRLQDSYEQLVGNDLLGDVYKEVRRRAPFARVVVLGYPRFYVEGGARNAHTDDYCAGVRIADQRWINANIRKLNSLIRDQAGSLGLQYVDIYDVGDGAELCGSSSQLFLNGVVIGNTEESYHPNSYGHELIADKVTSSLRTPDPGTYYNVRPGETITTTFRSTGQPLSVSTQWPGSDVVLSLTSPSGRVIDRGIDAADVQHEVGPTFESYHLAGGEPGTWTATLYGAQVAPQGEPTRLSVWNTPSVNQEPTARFSLSQDRRTITVDAGASTDADGNIIDYLWEFGDGTTASGSRATHTYTTAGDYLTTLAIRDNGGGEAFAAANRTVSIPEYDFAGFFPPVSPAPALNEVTAGRAVPMKFSLGGDHGLNIVRDGSPTSFEVDCATGATVGPAEKASTPGGRSVTFDRATETYNFVWKTEPGWTRTCRMFEMTLDDGSAHRAMFTFVR